MTVNEINPLRNSLDRVGVSLSSVGDTDLALCSTRLGLAVGKFGALGLKHLIPAARIELDYLLRLRHGLAKSHAILRYIWDGDIPRPISRPCVSERVFQTYKRWRAGRPDDGLEAVREMSRQSEASGIAEARAVILSLSES